MDDVKVPLQDIIDSLNETSWTLLKLIQERQELNFNEIKRETNLSQEKCYKELSRLEGGVLIKGNRRRNDLRVLGYRLTSFGNAALEYYLSINRLK